MNQELGPHTNVGVNRQVSPLRRLRLENELLRNKVFQLQRALIGSGVLPHHAPIGHPAAEVVPEERYLRGSADVTLAFGGVGQRLMLPPAEFLRTLIASGKTDVIFYKDFSQCWYQRGLLGISEDVPSTVEYIRRTLAERGYGRAYCLGTSAGGFAAILFGALLGATRILAFAPQTELTKQVFNRFRGVDSRFTEIPTDGSYLDLVKVLERTRYAGQIDIYYSAGHAVDRKAAERLARFPCVKLHPIMARQHNVAAHLRETGQLAAALDSLVSQHDAADAVPVAVKQRTG